MINQREPWINVGPVSPFSTMADIEARCQGRVRGKGYQRSLCKHQLLGVELGCMTLTCKGSIKAAAVS